MKAQWLHTGILGWKHFHPLRPVPKQDGQEKSYRNRHISFVINLTLFFRDPLTINLQLTPVFYRYYECLEEKSYSKVPIESETLRFPDISKHEQNQLLTDSIKVIDGRDWRKPIHRVALQVSNYCSKWISFLVMYIATTSYSILIYHRTEERENVFNTNVNTYVMFFENIYFDRVKKDDFLKWNGQILQWNMMTSSNRNMFRVTGHLCGEITGPRWSPRTKASDVAP